MNVVFDLGGVVFRWDPDRLLRRVFSDPRNRERARYGILGHDDWVALDRGTLGHAAAIERGVARTGLSPEAIGRLFGAVPESLTPIRGTLQLIRAVKQAGNRLYVLSNMQLPAISHLEQTHDIWGLFDGVVISSRIRMVKPDREIYEHLLSEYRLQAADTVFIDDMAENRRAAAKLGIRTIAFVDAQQCREDLVKLGCLSGRPIPVVR